MSSSETTNSDTHPRERRFLFLTIPRSASNLAVRILNIEEQPDVALPAWHGGYYFLPANLKVLELKLREKSVASWPEDKKKEMVEAYELGLKNMNQYASDAAAAGKIAFIKEHAALCFSPSQARAKIFDEDIGPSIWDLKLPSDAFPKQTKSKLNMTLLPDEFLETFLPTFLIRHPGLVVPSLYRKMLSGEEFFGTYIIPELRIAAAFSWPRAMYEYYANSLKGTRYEANWPVVLDADDIIKDPSLVKQYAEMIGIDPAKLKFEWDSVQRADFEVMENTEKLMFDTLLQSRGIRKDKLSEGFDLDVEAGKWKVEFGEEIAKVIEDVVRGSMLDYEFLKSKRMESKAL
ncbi:hypothetical protein BJ875DRAFT_462727 [Amylocarpus encephaloides]|uniref:Sulfotransferase domain-containing protein n=1 Tax=Amylocarpus encephaloides TaxID=45428 RepID=A0A9P7YHR1_9HELO|nr:hypothetical protein BJ875DRAFT_462727 [Amylocarpus encephaloides]